MDPEHGVLPGQCVCYSPVACHRIGGDAPMHFIPFPPFSLEPPFCAHVRGLQLSIVDSGTPSFLLPASAAPFHCCLFQRRLGASCLPEKASRWGNVGVHFLHVYTRVCRLNAHHLHAARRLCMCIRVWHASPPPCRPCASSPRCAHAPPADVHRGHAPRGHARILARLLAVSHPVQPPCVA